MGPLGALLVVVAALGAGPAAGQGEGPVRLRFEYVRGPGAESCPDQDMIADAVAARLGYWPFEDTAARLLQADVARTDGGYVAQLTLLDEAGEPSGERSLEAAGDDCFELARAMELAITIAVDPAAITRPAPAPLPEEEGPPPPPQEAAPPAPAPAPDEEEGGARTGTVWMRPATVVEVPNTDRPRTERVPAEGDPDFMGPPRPAPDEEGPLDVSPAGHKDNWLIDEPGWQLSGYSGLTWSSGTVPAPTFGYTVAGMGLRYRFLSSQLELRYDSPQSAASPSGKAAAVGWLTTLGGHLCVHQGWMFGCGSLFGGVQVLGAIGVAQPRLLTLPYLAAGGRAGADLPVLGWLGSLGRMWRLRVHADVAVPLPFARWRLRYDAPPNDVIWEVPPVAVVLGAAIVFVIPP